MSKECPICSSNDVSFVQKLINSDVETNVFRCESCDLDFLDTWDNVEYVKSLYEGDKYIFSHNLSESSDDKLKFNEYDKRYNWVKGTLDKNKSLLEIGCGDGKFLNMIRDDVNVAEGVELSPPQVKKLRDEGYTCYDIMIDEMEPPRQYDIVCMFALLEHVPRIGDFLQNLKKYIHNDSHVYIEVPNLNNLLVSGYDISEFRDFYYRPIHLYYFTPASLVKLLNKYGFDVDIHTMQQASLTNHFHWMHNKKGQPNANAMTSIQLPTDALPKLPMLEMLDQVDDYYRELCEKNQMGDLLSAHAVLAGKG